jgi:hypothetical protein
MRTPWVNLQGLVCEGLRVIHRAAKSMYVHIGFYRRKENIKINFFYLNPLKKILSDLSRNSLVL